MENTKESLRLMIKAFQFCLDYNGDLTFEERQELESAINKIEDELGEKNCARCSYFLMQADESEPFLCNKQFVPSDQPSPCPRDFGENCCYFEKVK